MSNPTDPLTALLQGIRPRAEVFAQLLCGDRQQADSALRAAMRAFRGSIPKASQEVSADRWAQRLWTLLLASPELRRPAKHPCWPPPFEGLQRLGLGERAAVLLRLVTGLDETDASSVLGISALTWRRALHRAIPRRADGQPDLDTWRVWVAAVDDMQHRTVMAYEAGERVSTPRAAPARVAPATTRPAHLQRWMQPILWAALVVCAVGLAASFLLPAGHSDSTGFYVQGIPLPPADAPASTYDADTALLTHGDFDQLLDVREEALVRDLDFYAWYAAQAASQPGADGGPLLFPDAGTPARPITQGEPNAR